MLYSKSSGMCHDAKIINPFILDVKYYFGYIFQFYKISLDFIVET
jgi:hypothetical protein